MTHPPAPAPLPPEEIERLELLVKHGNGVAVVEMATMRALLAELKTLRIRDVGWSLDVDELKAEIEAGRAGAERVRRTEAVVKAAEELQWVARRLPIQDALEYQTALWDALNGLAALRDGAPDPNCPSCHGYGGHQIADDPRPVFLPCECVLADDTQPADGAHNPTCECPECWQAMESGGRK